MDSEQTQRYSLTAAVISLFCSQDPNPNQCFLVYNTLWCFLKAQINCVKEITSKIPTNSSGLPGLPQVVFFKCTGSGSTNNHLPSQRPPVKGNLTQHQKIDSTFFTRNVFHQTLTFSSHHSYVIILFRSRDAKKALTAIQNITFMHFSLVILNIITSDAIKLISFKWINPAPNLEPQASNMRLLKQSFKPLLSVQWGTKKNSENIRFKNGIFKLIFFKWFC